MGCVTEMARTTARFELGEHRTRATEERELGSQPTATEGGHDRASARRGQDVSDGRYARRMGGMTRERTRHSDLKTGEPKKRTAQERGAGARAAPACDLLPQGASAGLQSGRWSLSIDHAQEQHSPCVASNEADHRTPSKKLFQPPPPRPRTT